MALKLMYRVKRVFFGESGIVEKVETHNLKIFSYKKYDLGDRFP